MPLIILMRHADAVRSTGGMRDIDRPLSTAGAADARTSAKYLSATGLNISKVFCSPAQRTMETLAGIQEAVPLKEDAIAYLPELYSSDTAAYHQLLNLIEENDVCLVIGHNPMIERFAYDLAQTGDQVGLATLKSGYPTAAICVLNLGKNFNPKNPQGHLSHFFNPN